jgi:hypothetical protein
MPHTSTTFSEKPETPKKASVDFLLRFSTALAHRTLSNSDLLTQQNDLLRWLRRHSKSGN